MYDKVEALVLTLEQRIQQGAHTLPRAVFACEDVLRFDTDLADRFVTALPNANATIISSSQSMRHLPIQVADAASMFITLRLRTLDDLKVWSERTGTSSLSTTIQTTIQRDV